MCVKPLTINGLEVSCRECDKCLATYKNSWVARSVAERNSVPYSYVITLTYADVDGQPPLGARVYRYKDVQDFWKRIRWHAQKRWGENIDFRYVIVGEKGTLRGRCHYHGVIFSSHPVVELGEFAAPGKNELVYGKRMDWTLWGHGFVQMDQCTRKSIAYVLKYILKSRMTVAKSEGHAREGKTEWLASSYLWCSKRPPIGATWLYDKLHDLTRKGLCPPSLRMRVSGGGDWYVSGLAQKFMCLYLREKNDEYRTLHDRELSGWNTLLNSVSEPIENTETGEVSPRKPWEWLVNGEEEQDIAVSAEQAQAEYEKLKNRIETTHRLAARVAADRRFIRECGNVKPCDKCFARLTDKQKANIEQEEKFLYQEFLDRYGHGAESERTEAFKRFWWTRLRPSRGCILRDAPEIVGAFERQIPLTRSQPKLAARKAVGKALQKAPG